MSWGGGEVEVEVMRHLKDYLRFDDKKWAARQQTRKEMVIKKKKVKTTFQSRPAIQLNENLSLVPVPDTKLLRTDWGWGLRRRRRSPTALLLLNCKRQRDSHHQSPGEKKKEERWRWMQVEGILCNFVHLRRRFRSSVRSRAKYPADDGISFHFCLE